MRGYSEDMGFGLGGFTALLWVAALVAFGLHCWPVYLAAGCAGVVLFPVWLIRTLVRWLSRQWHSQAPRA